MTSLTKPYQINAMKNKLMSFIRFGSAQENFVGGLNQHLLKSKIEWFAVDSKASVTGGVITVALLLGQPVHAEIQTNSAYLTSTQSKAWIQQGEALRDSGALLDAQNWFDKAVSSPDNSDHYVAALTASGYNLFLLNKTELAEQQLKDAYQQSVKSNSYLHALSSEYLGSLYLSQGADDEALRYFNEALQLAETKRYRDLEASIILQKSVTQEIDNSLLSEKLAVLPEGYAKARLQLQWAEHLLDVDSSMLSATETLKLTDLAYQAITEAKRVADLDKRIRFQAEVAATLARLYYQQARYDDALTLADRGIALASSDAASELTVRLNKLKGDCLRQQGNTQGALQAYALAVDTLNLIKNELPINLPNGQSAVEVLIDPVYRGYVDLLLLSANDTKMSAGSNKMLSAMQNMEIVKKADLQEFFLSRCAIALDNHTDWAKQSFPGAVVLYPIVFSDRLELILKSGETIYHHTINVSADELKQQVDTLVFALQNGKNYKSAAKQLNEWFFDPIRNDLQRLKTQTIVYVPDRSLRGMPIAALYDGEHFVVEQQAIVTLPSLDLENLYRPKLEKKTRKTLIVGISKPDGPSVDQLPKGLASNLSGSSEAFERDMSSEKSRQVTRSKLVDALSLPGVEKEVAEIASLTKSQPLLNNKFTVDTFKADLGSAKYSNIHIASHGYFGKNVKDSFVMAYDRNLSLQNFEDSLETDKLKKNPIDLLTLSACETAEGNDRMLLGFSGLAVKSNALSAVGSLWSINDAAALQFMKIFYTGLNQSLSKVQAVQQAQVAMINSKEYQHPYYWSPFVLIGNWQ